MNAQHDALTYVYAVVRQTEPLREALTHLRGIGEAPVRLLGHPADPADTSDAGPALLSFVISAVPQRDFNEAALKDHFEDLEWLENVARAHHDVVQAVAAHATILPLRMATVYQDDSRARQALVAQRHTFAERLAQLASHTEFGVKIYLPAPASGSDPEAPAGSDQAAAAATTPGKAYLQHRRAQHHAREAIYRQAQGAAETIEALAARHAAQRVRHAPQRGTLAGAQENVLNDAYLIPDEQTDQFRAAIARAAQDFPEIRIEVTGPWAPYSFAMPPPETPAAADASKRVP
ncbi:GvpL/GvpF family gas vesicle protein [Streptomyces sp. NBC_01353]|uniref:GvpL/GvpF family gas vesicle protein n=1 Tax=Streptomyces sp. NBC_01353 TaxID=2903835 RepID=UPI002E355FB0|nr:GvpL/GvpF family gas vesicle protein [Streptomyces sp. NBC_01353]